jgi:hypothetical protein
MKDQIVFVLRAVQREEPWIRPRVLGVYSTEQIAIEMARTFKQDKLIDVSWETYEIEEFRLDAGVGDR